MSASASNPKLAARVGNADLILALGPRLGEMTTGGYTLIAAPVPRQRLIHIIPTRKSWAACTRPKLMINSGMPQAARDAGGDGPGRQRRPGATRSPKRKRN